MSDPSAPRFPAGEYQIDGLIGSGAMSMVYRARDVRRSRDVAMKVLRPELTQVVGAERFRREIAVVSRLSHPHILPLLDAGETDRADGTRAPYYVMPLVEGETLEQRLSREIRLPLGDAVRIAHHILDALQYAHAHGVLHRDVKPANVMLSGSHAIVADFGLARLMETDPAGGATSRLTSTGFVVGSPAYMSPEQALGDADIDERSDLFAFGCVLYEMLTGVDPFDAPTAQASIARKVNGMFVPVHALRPGVPEAVDAVLRRALAPERSDRYANAAELNRAIEGLELGSRSTPVIAVDAPKPARRRLWPAVVAVSAALGAGLFAMQRIRAADVAPVATTPDVQQSHIAVLPLEAPAGDSALTYIADGFTVDLIDELSRYRSLTVISRNGVRAFAGSTLSPDSIAAVLHVGSIITGDIRRAGDEVRVAVRLVDAQSNAQIGKAETRGRIKDLLMLRTAMIDSVTGFLRSTIGARIVQQRRENAVSAEAWTLVAEARTIQRSELAASMSWAESRRERRFSAVEQMLVRAAQLDTRWPAPYLTASELLLDRAVVEEVIAFAPATQGPRSPSARSTMQPEAYRRRALRYAEQGLARDVSDAESFVQRGRARMALWTTASASVADTLLSAAESDFRRALALRDDLAPAWNELSKLLQHKGDFSGAADAADAALEADAFLERAGEVINRLAITSLASGRIDAARRWCARRQQQFPNDPRFWSCELTILGWTGTTPADVGLGWQRLAASEQRDSLNLLVTGQGTRRLLVAAIAARAGLADSARAIVARVRATPSTPAATMQNDYGEAYVQTLLGNPDSAITLLERYLRAQPSRRTAVRTSPWFAPLRNDARFIRSTAAP